MCSTYRRGDKEVTCQTRADETLTFENSFYTRQQFPPRVGLQDITACTRVQSFFGRFQRAGLAKEENFRSG